MEKARQIETVIINIKYKNHHQETNIGNKDLNRYISPVPNNVSNVRYTVILLFFWLE